MVSSSSWYYVPIRIDPASQLSFSINAANDTNASVISKGVVNLPLEVRQDVDVLYAPDLALNLLSVSKICHSGYQVTF